MEKAALRASAIYELGERFDDKLERKRFDVSSAQGAAAAFSEAGKTIEQIMMHVDKDINDEKINLEEGKLVKTWLTRCHFALSGLCKKSENQVFISQGQVTAMMEIIDATKKFYDVESSKIPKPEEEVDAEITDETQDAVEPQKQSEEESTISKKRSRPKSIKQQRQAQQLKKKTAAKKKA